MAQGGPFILLDYSSQMYINSIKSLQWEKSSNNVVSKVIDIDDGLSCFIVMSNDDIKSFDPIFNKVIDTLLDNLWSSYTDVYNNFSISLDQINSFLKSFEEKWNEIAGNNIIIGLLEKTKFHFSKIWNASCYLMNENEVTEVSYSIDSVEEFSYISSWDLKRNDIVFLSNIRLFDYLTKTDLLEAQSTDEVDLITENVVGVLTWETLQESLDILSFQVIQEEIIKESKIYKTASELLYRLSDNNFVKRILAFGLLFREKIDTKGKTTKNIIFASWIIVSFFLLSLIIGSVVSTTTNSKDINLSKEKLIEARKYIRVASENISNNDVFDLNIKKAEEIVFDVKNKQLFLNDIDKILNDISVIKKQFNWIETFDANTTNIIYSKDLSWIIDLITLNNKYYFVNKNSIVWPYIIWQEPKEFSFENLWEDTFIDAVTLWNDIMLITKESKVVSFWKSKEFKFVDVIGQDKWESANFLATYGSNIYLVDNKDNQIYKHQPLSSWFASGIPYIRFEDSKNFWKDIASIWIDGWIYILNKDLTLFKLFVTPKYRLESIRLDKLPKNYNLTDPTSQVTIITRNDLYYVYFFFNNKIWIFEPGSRRYQDVKHLTYLWQIEWKSNVMKSVHITHDGEVLVANDKWLYKMMFEITDWKLIVR